MELVSEFKAHKAEVSDLHSEFASHEDFDTVGSESEELEAFLSACATKEKGAQDFIRGKMLLPHKSTSRLRLKS